jgi:ArsR family transcriptional regulator
MQALNISQARASRNLSKLYDAGLIKLRKDGLWSLYSIDKDGMDRFSADLINALRKTMQGNKVMEADKERLSHAVRVGPEALAK